MRIWEIDDNTAIPSDLVREQDFILRVRRLNRLNTPHLVVNLVLSAIPALIHSRRAREAMQKQFQEFARITHGDYSEMSNGDIFINWEEGSDAQHLTKQLTDVLSKIPAHTAPIDPEKPVDSSETQNLRIYHMPKDYTQLRERSNHYIDVARSGAQGTRSDVALSLQTEAARGPMTPWSMDQVGKLISDIDLRPYGRTQAIYQNVDNHWQPVAEEYFVSFEDLRRERFPKLDLITPEHLFLALCEKLDQQFLTALTDHPERLTGKNLQINLAVASVITPAFAGFTHSLTHQARGKICFELHRGDLLQDFARTLSAMELLHREGFKVALDSITPDIAPYLNLERFPVDYIKINVSAERAAMLSQKPVREALSHIPAEKLIFFRCDNEASLQVGRELGVKLFQGWLIDEKAGVPVKAQPGNPID